MEARVAEDVVRRGLLRRRLRLRVDLHGVSTFGPGDARTLIRWEAVTRIEAGDGVTVGSPEGEIRFPPGAFGLEAGELRALLDEARSIERRPAVIGRLGGR